MPVAVLVEVGVHPRSRIGDDVELAQRHLFAGLNLDIGHAEVQALGRDHHRQRRINLVEVTQHQRLGTGAAVDVGRGVEVAERGGRLADDLDRVVDLARGQHAVVCAFADLGQIVLRHVLGQRLVGPSARLAEFEQRHRHHVARAREAFRKPAVGIERLLGLLQQRDELRQLSGRRRRHGRVRIGRCCRVGGRAMPAISSSLVT